MLGLRPLAVHVIPRPHADLGKIFTITRKDG